MTNSNSGEEPERIKEVFYIIVRGSAFETQSHILEVAGYMLNVTFNL